MASSASLYTGIIVEGSRDKAHEGAPDSGKYQEGTGVNPVCGDKITWYVRLDQEKKVIREAKFTSAGCMISRASAGLLAEMVQGKSADEFLERYRELKKATDIKESAPEIGEETLQGKKWLALVQIRGYPARRKCAMLAWDTLAEVVLNSLATN